MNILHALHQLLGAHPVAPHSGAAPGGFPFQAGPEQQTQAQHPQTQHQPIAQHGLLQADRAYNSGPMSASVNHPMVGGMPALGSSFHNLQGGIQNPGFIPMQGSMGVGTSPQMGAYGGVQRPGDQFNPQDQQDGYFY